MSRRAEHAVWEARNARVATGLAPLLVLTGALGFALPPHLALLSGAPAYNLFHIAAGLTGMALVARAGGRGAAGFNLGFGLIDLYQAVAGAAGLFPPRSSPGRRPPHGPGARPGGPGGARPAPGGGRGPRGRGIGVMSAGFGASGIITGLGATPPDTPRRRPNAGAAASSPSRVARP
jgi:hypothetical protein